MAESFSYFESFEGIAEQDQTEIQLKGFIAKKFVVTNDDVGNQKLFFKFNGKTKYGMLRAGESISVLFRSDTLYLKGDTPLYRAMIFG